MTDRHLISVIVPAWNHERFIDASLDSLVAQTYPHLELIVLDDGSTDGTWARIEARRPELNRRFVRVEAGTKANEGSSATISQCLERSQSDLVYLLDSDDVADPSAIDCLLPLMAAPDVALAVGDNQYIDEAGAPAYRERDGERCSTLLDFFTRDLAGFSVERDFGSYRSLIQGNYVPNGWLIRRSAVADVGGYPGGFALDDWPLLLQLSKKYRLRFAGKVLGQYRLHETNTVAAREDRLRLDTARILLRERGYCRAHGLEAEWWKHAHRVFEPMEPDDIRTLALDWGGGQDARDSGVAAVEDLVRLGRRETDLIQLRWDLDSANRHREELEQLLEDARALLASLPDREADRERLSGAERLVGMERDRLASLLEQETGRLREADAERTQLARERGRLQRDLAVYAARLAALEASRTWRWSNPLRAAVGAVRGRPARRWDACLDPASSDAESLGGLVVSGWAFHRDSPVTHVEISIPGQRPVPATFGLERADVAAAFPSADVGRPGFRASLHAIEDPVMVGITIFCADGRAERVLCRLERTPALNAQARAIYGAPSSSAVPSLGRGLARLRHGTIGPHVWESRRIRGWIRGNGEALALAGASASLTGAPLIVEVGSFLGCSTVLLAGPRKDRGAGRVHCVDSFSAFGDDVASPVYRAIADSLGMPLRQAFEDNLRRAGVADWVTVHDMRAHAAAARWDTPIDMLYLDGDVSMAGSREAFLDWSPFLRPGGILAINGTLERAPGLGSYKVVEEFVRPPDFDEVRQIDHITFARKAPAERA